jgi:hypothetical protein
MNVQHGSSVAAKSSGALLYMHMPTDSFLAGFVTCWSTGKGKRALQAASSLHDMTILPVCPL